MKIEIFSRFSFKKMRKLWYFRVRAANGEITVQSEGVYNKADSTSTAISLRNGLGSADVVYL